MSVSPQTTSFISALPSDPEIVFFIGLNDDENTSVLFFPPSRAAASSSVSPTVEIVGVEKTAEATAP